jgi:hypothetical protein
LIRSKARESLPVHVTMRTSCEQNEEAQRDFSESTKRRNEPPGGNRKTWQDPRLSEPLHVSKCKCLERKLATTCIWRNRSSFMILRALNRPEGQPRGFYVEGRVLPILLCFTCYHRFRFPLARWCWRRPVVPPQKVSMSPWRMLDPP